MKLYQRVKVIAGTSIGHLHDAGNSEVPAISSVDQTALNGFLEDGWLLIQIITHYSHKHDQTTLAYVIGLPQPDTK